MGRVLLREALTITAGVFKLPLHSLNTLGEQQELSAGVDHLHSTIRSFEAQIQSFQRHVSSHPADLGPVQSKLGGLEASLEVFNHQLSIFWAFIAVQSARDEIRRLVGAQKRQVFKDILGPVRFISTIIPLFSIPLT